MRAIPSAPSHIVTIERPGQPPIAVQMRAPPLGYAGTVERYFPPPVEFVNGKPVPVEARQAEYRSLMAFILVAACLDGEDRPATVAPTGGTPADWETYARALRSEFEAAGYCEGDVMRLVQGYNVVMQGRGEGGKASSASAAAGP